MLCISQTINRRLRRHIGKVITDELLRFYVINLQKITRWTGYIEFQYIKSRGGDGGGGGGGSLLVWAEPVHRMVPNEVTLTVFTLKAREPSSALALEWIPHIDTSRVVSTGISITRFQAWRTAPALPRINKEFNLLGPEQNVQHFANVIFKCIFSIKKLFCHQDPNTNDVSIGPCNGLMLSDKSHYQGQR